MTTEKPTPPTAGNQPAACDVTAPSDAALKLPIAATTVGRFLEGASAPWVGARYLYRHPSLWRYAIWPTIANLFITTLVLAAIVGVGFLCIAIVHPYLTDGQSGLLRWGLIVGEIIAGLLLFVVAGFAAMLVYRFLTGILCGYFYGKLAEQIEYDLGIDHSKIKSISLHYEMTDTGLDMLLIAAAYLGFFALNAIPLIGGLLGVILSIWFTFYLVGTDYFARPLALRGVRRAQQFRYSWRRQPMVIGLGSVVFLTNFVPIVGALLLTSATVGAVILHRRDENDRDALRKVSSENQVLPKANSNST